jgi:hypothetical protein
MTKMLTHTGVLDSPLTLVSNCFVRDCSKPSFMGYYVCAEHFVFYAAARYTESMVINVELTGSGVFTRKRLPAAPASENTPNPSQQSVRLGGKRE